MYDNLSVFFRYIRCAEYSNNYEPPVINDDIILIGGISYRGFFIESIKCHHNDFANYIFNIYIQKDDDDDSNKVFVQCLKYESSFGHLCHYDYYSIVKFLFTNNDIDINSKAILNHIIHWH